MARRRRNRWLDEARMEALVRFGPELSALAELGRTAREQRSQTIASARGTAAGITAAVDRAVPEVGRVYDRAGLQQAAIARTVEPDVNAAGVAPSIRAAAALEMGSAQERTGESRAASLTDLATRRVQAQSGKQWAIKAAQQQFRTDITKVLTRLQDLRREQGAFTASTLGKLQQDAADRRLRVQIEQMGNTQSERNSRRSSGIDPDTGLPIPGGKLDPKRPGGPSAFKPATAVQQAAAKDQLDNAVHWVQKLSAAGASPQEIEGMLAEGRKEREVALKDPNTGKALVNPDGTPRTKRTPGVPQIKSDLLIRAALEMAGAGFVSKRTLRLLHARGLRLDTLGLRPQPTKAQIRRRDRRRKGRFGPNG